MKAFTITIILSLLTLSAHAVQPIILLPQGYVANSSQIVRFDVQSLNDWRQEVEAGRTSDQDLALSFYQLMLSMEFHQIVGKPVLQGRLSPKESKIIVKSVRVALENINDSFSFWPLPSVWERRQAALAWTMECVASLNQGYPEEKNLSECNSETFDTQPLSTAKDRLQAGQSLVVFYRIGKFLESFEGPESSATFLQAYQSTEDGKYSYRFIEKYFLRSKYLSSVWDGASMIGIFMPQKFRGY